MHNCTASAEAMLKLTPYINTEFWDTIINIMTVKDYDLKLFKNDPVEF